eukprot:gene20018-25993_t
MSTKVTSKVINFEDVQPKISNELLSAVKTMGFTQMTPVQASTIPLFLSHKDVLVDAITGSGKTLAFGIPMFEILSRETVQLNKYDVGGLVIAPTRELATQIYEVFMKLSTNINHLTCCLSTGGTRFNEAVQNITTNGVNILIGTPDEADTLLDMGFKETINQILQLLPKQRRTGLFSATQTNEVKELARAAARGIDIPDIDWIIQLVAPKDPSFFVHRVGRTARAGRSGGAIIFLTNDESPYIELLKGRGVPLVEYPSNTTHSISEYNILDELKSQAKVNREILEFGTKAFISFLRSVARSYGLLRLPKIPETNGLNLNNIDFERSDINTNSIPYKHKEKEKARLKRLQILKDNRSKDESNDKKESKELDK